MSRVVSWRMIPSSVPRLSGDLDADYLSAALNRAGVKADVSSMAVEPLTGGRMGADVRAIAAGDNRFVVKIVPAHGWKQEALGHPDCSEGMLWHSGLLRELPSEFRYPVVDAALHEKRDEWWVLMRDVSAGVHVRTRYDDVSCKRLLTTVARVHGHYWQHPALATAPLATLDGTTRIFGEPMLQVARGGEPTEPWIARAVVDLGMVLGLVPKFLDYLSSDDADFFLSLITERDRWQRPLAQLPTTLVHGDLRRANIAFFDDHIAAFDWELTTAAHPAVDIQWFWFLRFWAYPPADGVTIAGREPLRAHYIAALDDVLDGQLDRDELDLAMDLAWLRTMVQLGLCLADGEPDVVGPLCCEAVRRSRVICDERQL
jgi:hypothetical protein